jgi:hypothetical protein
MVSFPWEMMMYWAEIVGGWAEHIHIIIGLGIALFVFTVVISIGDFILKRRNGGLEETERCESQGRCPHCDCPLDSET